MNEKDIVTAFDVIAGINDLHKVEGTTNIFTDWNDVRYYLDRYGFHTAIQFSNHKLLQQERKLLNLYETIIGSVVPKEVLGKQTKNNLRAILENKSLSDEQKLSSIASIVCRLEPQEVRIQDLLIQLLSRYVNP